MELTSENVNALFRDCLFEEGEDMSNPIVAEGIVSKFGFHENRLISHASEISRLLLQLPEEFQEETGGGWSFLNSCDNTNRKRWTDFHQDMEQLMVLGIAIGKVKYQMPREMWKILPGGMPYFVVVK